jgi:hypothetical protein
LDEADEKKNMLAKLLDTSEFVRHWKTGIIKINSVENETKGGMCVLVLPGIDGIASNLHYLIAKSLQLPTFALHYFHTFHCANVQEIAEFVYEVTMYFLRIPRYR